jgi:hypothetical protein
MLAKLASKQIEGANVASLRSEIDHESLSFADGTEN